MKNINKDTAWKICAVFCLSALMMSFPEMTLASDSSDTIGNTLCKIVERLTGRIGKGIATLAVVFLGIGLFFGKLSWGLAVAIGIGIGGIFGAEQIANWIGGSAAEKAKCFN